MSLSRALVDELREFVTACVGHDWPGRASQARRLLDRLERADVRAAERTPPEVAPGATTGRIDKSALAFPPPAGGSTKHARRLERIPKVRDLRFAVMKRAREWFGNRCEWCRTYEPVTMHHVLKGADRVAEESETSCAALCETCDDRTEAEPSWARSKAHGWALALSEAARRRGLPELAAGFDHTAGRLEGKIALAEAQARASTNGGTP